MYLSYIFLAIEEHVECKILERIQNFCKVSFDNRYESSGGVEQCFPTPLNSFGLLISCHVHQRDSSSVICYFFKVTICYSFQIHNIYPSLIAPVHLV